MLKLEPIEFFLRGFPEGFLIMLAIYVFSNKSINKKNYIIMSLISSCIIFLVRALPVNYGVHTIISVGLIIALSAVMEKIDAIKVIKSTLIYTIFQSIAEGINVIIIEKIFKTDITIAFGDPVKKSIYGIPSLMIVFILIMAYYMLAQRREKKCLVQ